MLRSSHGRVHFEGTGWAMGCVGVLELGDRKNCAPQTARRRRREACPAILGYMHVLQLGFTKMTQLAPDRHHDDRFRDQTPMLRL